MDLRRVVTGHDADGRAVVKIDGPAGAVSDLREGATGWVVWTTEGFPVDNTDDTDGGAVEVGTTRDDGTVFRVVRYEPGVAPRRHRTDSIDYGVVVSGAIDMELDDGHVVTLRAGDMLVQRGTVHNWVNRGPEACVIAFVLIDAHPVTVGGAVLEAEG